MKQTIKDKKLELEVINKEIEYFDASDYVNFDSYDEMIDDCNDEVVICGMCYTPSYALKEIDPIAYDVGFHDYCSNMELDSIPEYNKLVEDAELLQLEIEEIEALA